MYAYLVICYLVSMFQGSHSNTRISQRQFSLLKQFRYLKTSALTAWRHSSKLILRSLYVALIAFYFSVIAQVAPSSLHPAFDKAGHYFDVEIRHVAVDTATLVCDLDKYEAAIDENTIFIAASAPSYPQVNRLNATAARRMQALCRGCGVLLFYRIRFCLYLYYLPM